MSRLPAELFGCRETPHVVTPLAFPEDVRVDREDGAGLVALRHTQLAEDGDRNPTATMARLGEVALSTAQGWVAKARARGLLPPGRRGRAG